MMNYILAGAPVVLALALLTFCVAVFVIAVRAAFFPRRRP